MAANGASNPFRLMRMALDLVRARVRGRRLVEMTAAMLLMLLVAVIVAVPPTLLGQIVTKSTRDGRVEKFDVFPNIEHIRSFSDVVPYLVLLTILILMREGLTLVRKYFVEKVATSIEAEEYFRVSNHVLSLDLSEFTAIRSGAINVSIHRSIEGLVQFLKLSFMEFVPIIATALVALVAALFQSPVVAAMMVCVALFGLMVTAVQIRSQQGVRQYLFEAKKELSANISEVLNGIDYVRASGMIAREADRTRQFAENFRRTEFRHHKWMISFDTAKQVVEGLGYVTIIGLAAWLASRGRVEYGNVLTFAMLYASFTTPLQSLHRILDEGWEACQKVNELIQLYGKRADPGLAGTQQAQTVAKVVVFRGVSVSYALGEEAQFAALDGVDLEIAHGEIVGIAGPSGSGKSTLVKLILGLTATYTGSARLFGVEARDIDKRELATRIAYVPQTPFLVKGNIQENVCYTSSEAPTGAELETALRSACFAEKVRATPGGLNAPVAEQGRNLSGGERQRLALTRLFLSKAQLLVLDEPTSALDASSQEAVQEAIFAGAVGRSAIIVAHRLNTLKRADRIIVLNKGRIVESGSYDELVDKADGLFRGLVDKEKLERQFAK